MEKKNRNTIGGGNNMAWQTPKTDWVSTDFFNIQDWNRIRGNIQYIKELCDRLYDYFTINGIEEKTYSSMLYAKEINALEEDIYKINMNTYSVSANEQKSWAANMKAPSYEDFNRWERMTLKLKQSLEGQMDSLPRLSFILGQGRDIQI